MSKNTFIRNYKHLLNCLSSKRKVIVTISVWTFNSKRMTFKLDFDKMHHLFDSYVELKFFSYKNIHYLEFKTIHGDKFKFAKRKVKIAKVDGVEFIKST